MNFLNLQTELAAIVNLDVADTTNLTNIKRWLNFAYKDICSRYRFSWLDKYDRFQTTIIYSTGTVTVTNGSRAVAGNGTSWTSAMVGRYFNCMDNQDWYKIIAVGSTTSLTIDKPYLRDTKTNQPHYVWRKLYNLNSDVLHIVDMFLDLRSASLRCFDSKEFEVYWTRFIQGWPQGYYLSDLDYSTTTYSTGKVTGTVNTRTLTGESGAAFLDNVTPGDKVTISSYSYYVDTVDSDTQLTLTSNLMAAAASASYSITQTGIKRVALSSTPVSNALNINYKYTRKVYDMQNDSDEPYVPERWREVLIDGAKKLAYSSFDDSRESQALQIYEGKIKQMIKEDVSSSEPPFWTRG